LTAKTWQSRLVTCGGLSVADARCGSPRRSGRRHCGDRHRVHTARVERSPTMTSLVSGRAARASSARLGFLACRTTSWPSPRGAARHESRPSAEPVIRTRAIVNLLKLAASPVLPRPGCAQQLGRRRARGFAISKQELDLTFPDGVTLALAGEAKRLSRDGIHRSLGVPCSGKRQGGCTARSGSGDLAGWRRTGAGTRAALAEDDRLLLGHIYSAYLSLYATRRGRGRARKVLDDLERFDADR